jgi:transcription elongation factor GreA-like protein
VFQDAHTILKGAIIGVMEDPIVDAYVMISTSKDISDALKEKYEVSNTGSELHVMEQFHDYKMTGGHFVVELRTQG